MYADVAGGLGGQPQRLLDAVLAVDKDEEASGEDPIESTGLLMHGIQAYTDI